MSTVNVQEVVRQMDQTTWALRTAWQQVDSRWAIMFTSEQAQAAEARLRSLRGLIDDLDVGGVAREHVFFPLPGQSEEQAWDTYRETAEYVRQGISQLGGFVSTWSLAPTLARIGSDVKQTVAIGASIGAGIGLLFLFAVLAWEAR